MATVGQNIGQTLEEQNLEFYCDCIERKQNEKLNEKLKPLPGLVALNLRQRAALGWNKVHEHISKLPFCHKRQQIVCMIICFDYKDCRFEGCCYPCLKRAKKLHKVSIRPPIESIPDFPTKEYNPFLEICSRDCDWHEWYHYFYNCLTALQAASFYSM